MKSVLPIVLSSFVLLPSAFPQGSLTPPGAPAPTMKKLDEVEPRTNLQATPAPAGVDTSNPNYQFVINQPGSYYLSANLLVTKTNGIQINAEGVTLDLNGFQISRATPSGNGIEIPAASAHATVRNGTISGFFQGIFSNAQACAFRDLAVSGCTNYGIRAGYGTILESCRAFQNSGTAGIETGWGSTLSNCAATRNAATYGINAASASALTNCAASLNSGAFGINAASGSSLTNCSASFNTGIPAISGGINADYGSTLTHCTAYWNDSNLNQTPTTGMGIYVNVGCTIQNSTVQFNDGDGISVHSECLVRENNCVFNFAGIRSTDRNNRIEGNNVTGNTRGISVEGMGSLIIKNSADNNLTNYSIAANNRYGPIVDISAAGAPAVSGKSAADTTGTSHPWANFSY
jgi:parallel beta-helix repeat protein